MQQRPENKLRDPGFIAPPENVHSGRRYWDTKEPRHLCGSILDVSPQPKKMDLNQVDAAPDGTRIQSDISYGVEQLPALSGCDGHRTILLRYRG